jgi:hypothetical protein
MSPSHCQLAYKPPFFSLGLLVKKHCMQGRSGRMGLGDAMCSCLKGGKSHVSRSINFI